MGGLFRCEILGGQLTLNDKVSGFQWAMPAEVKEMADEAFAVRVLDALSEQPHAAIRQHDGIHVKWPGVTAFSTVSRAHLRRARPSGPGREQRGSDVSS
jgi:hypothetical protein